MLASLFPDLGPSLGPHTQSRPEDQPPQDPAGPSLMPLSLYPPLRPREELL